MSTPDLQYESDEYHEDAYDLSLHRDDSLPDLVLSAALPPPSLASNTTSTSTADLEAEYFGGAASDQVTTEVSSRSGSIRVQYTDTDKPYVSQRMTVSADKYHSYLNLTAPSDEESGDESVQEEFKSLSPETQSQQRLEWAQELADLDTEIGQLEATLRSKVRYAQNLKRSLGLTAWREFSSDMREGVRRLQESPALQRVEAELASLASRVEQEAGKVTRRTSSGLVSAHKRLSQQLQRLGVVEPPREYRRDEAEPVIAPSSRQQDT